MLNVARNRGIQFEEHIGNILNFLRHENINVLHECKDGIKDIHRAFGPISGIDHILIIDDCMIFIQDKWISSTISSNHISQFTTAIRSVLHSSNTKPSKIILIYNSQTDLSKPSMNIMDQFKSEFNSINKVISSTSRSAVYRRMTIILTKLLVKRQRTYNTFLYNSLCYLLSNNFICTNGELLNDLYYDQIYVYDHEGCTEMICTID